VENIGTKRLETERLILRKGSVNDAEEIFNNYCTDPLVTKYVTWDVHKSIDDSIKYLRYFEDSYRKEHSYNWLIESKEINQIIGAITAINVDVKNRTIEIGYCLGSNWWNKGYMTESLKRVIQFLFEEVCVETIYAEHWADNPSSGKVMLKSGMKYEGALRSRLIDKNTNKPTNLESYSIIREDYFNNK